MNFWSLVKGIKFSKSEKEYIQEQLDKLEAMEKEHNLHPILRFTLHMSLTDDAESFKNPLPQDVLDRVEHEVQLAYARKPGEAAWAVFSLIQLSLHFSLHLKLIHASHQLTTLCNDLILRLDLTSLVDATEQSSKQDDAKTQAGLKTKREAPKVGAKAPEGSLKLDALNFPKRL